MGQGASSLQQQRNRKKNRCVTDDNEFIDVFNASFSSFQNTTTEKEDDDNNKEEEENTSDNNENRNFARRTRKRLNELRELAPSTAKPMLVLNALSDEEDEDTTSKSKKKNGSNDRRSWQKVFDVLDAYERHQEDGDGDKYSSKSELIAKLREVAKAIRLAAKNTTEEEDDDFYEAQHTSEGKPTPPSRLLSSPISKTPPPVQPRKLRAKNRKKNDDDDAKDDGENDDDENDSDDDENATGGVYSEYVRNTDDLLVVAEKLSSLL
jgi:hypothetical protein